MARRSLLLSINREWSVCWNEYRMTRTRTKNRTAMILETLEMYHFPEEFDPYFYHNSYPDLQHLTDDQLKEHYCAYGFNECRAPNQILDTACTAAIGFITLIIAHHLAGSGDTLEMLQAVLETNIWLATHVVVVFQARILKRNRRDIRCTSSRGHKAAAHFVSQKTLVGFGPFFPYIGNICSSNTCRIV